MNTNDQIRTVVFDVDGTLFDTLPSLAAAANEVLVLAGLQAVEPQHLRPALSQGITALFQSALRLQAASVPLALASRLEDAFAHRYASHWLHQAVVYDGALDLLSMLRSQRIALGICTNRDQDSTRTLLDKAALTGFFDAIVGLGDTEHPKPDAAPLHLALTQLGATPQTALFVGDSGIDARCAHAAQVRFAGHLGGYANHPDDLLPQVVSFNVYDQLTQWVLQRLPTDTHYLVTLGGEDLVDPATVIDRMERTSAKGNRFAFLQCSDQSGAFECVMFSELLSSKRNLLEAGQAILISVDGRLDGGDVPRGHDRHDRAEAVHLRLRQSVARRIRQARIVHARDLRVTRHGLGHRLRIGIVLAHAHDQRAQAARQQRGGFR